MKKTLSAALTVLALGLPVQGEASYITILNGGFEGRGGFWTVPAQKGKQIAFPSDALATLSQVVSDHLAANTSTDTLSGLAGHQGYRVKAGLSLIAAASNLEWQSDDDGEKRRNGIQHWEWHSDDDGEKRRNGKEHGESRSNDDGEKRRNGKEHGESRSDDDDDDDDGGVRAVSDGGLTLLLLGMGMTGLGLMRRTRA